jgi:hypothetical protein
VGSGGLGHHQSVKRTAEPRALLTSDLSVVRFTDLIAGGDAVPSTEVLGYFQEPALRTSRYLALGEADAAGKNLRRRNNESGTQDRFADAISFARFVLLVFNEDVGANAFTLAHTGSSAKSVCSSTGAAATGRHDGLRR